MKPDFAQANQKIIEHHLTSKNVKKGEIYTKAEVVHFMLDLMSYHSSKDLCQFSLLEPSFGKGDFLKVAVARLIKSFFKYHTGKNPFFHLADCIRAVELSKNSYQETYKTLFELMYSYGIESVNVKSILECWLLKSDFLLTDFKGREI